MTLTAPSPILIDLDELIDAAGRLDPLPQSLVRLAQLVSDSDSSLEDIVTVVSVDPGLAARVLRIANSAGMGGRGTIGTVKEAVVRIGRSMLLGISMASQVRGSVDRPLPEYGLGPGELWEHAVRGAVAAELVAQRTRRRPPPMGFTAGLLHDIGKIVLSEFLRPDVLGYLDKATTVGRTRSVAERELLGVDHAELGGLIARSWALPEELAEAIQYHHAPGAIDSPLADVLHVADAVAHRVAGSDQSVDTDVQFRTGIRTSDLAGLAEQTAQRYDKLKTSFGG